MKYVKIMSATIFLCLGVSSNFAYSVEVLNMRGVNFNTSKNNAHSPKQRIKSIMGLKEFEDFRDIKTYKSTHLTTKRYQQLYRGIPVIGGDVSVSYTRSNIVKNVHGNFLSEISADVLSVIPTLSSRDVLNIAKGLNSKGQIKNENTVLAIWKNKQGKAKLVYQVEFLVSSTILSRPNYIFDAMTGDILDYYDNLQSGIVNASGVGGNIKTGQRLYDGVDFPLLNGLNTRFGCVLYGLGKVETLSFDNSEINPGGVNLSCGSGTALIPDYTSNGGFGPISDAHYHGMLVYDMYNDWFGTPPLTFLISIGVHYGTNEDFASWNGSSVTIGDGNLLFHPLVSLDIISHEISHGFTEQNSGLVYSNRSGGLNEAFSDMAGEAAEFYATGTNDWLVGEEVWQAEGALRFMNNPIADGNSIDNQADYVAGMDVHFSSGVFNRAFHILATTTGWNTRTAFEVYARANMLYWTSNTNWNQAGNGVMDAANDLGYDVDDVQDSLNAVGIISFL